jgi:hypothetical protein
MDFPPETPLGTGPRGTPLVDEFSLELAVNTGR